MANEAEPDSERRSPRLQTQPDRGSGGFPPRRTAVGLTGGQDDGEYHVGQTVACVVLTRVSDGYIVELEGPNKIRTDDGWELFIHACLLSRRSLKIGERTLGRIKTIQNNTFVLDDSVLSYEEVERKSVDPTLPSSGAPAIPRTVMESMTDPIDEFLGIHELERIPESKPTEVASISLSSSSCKEEP